ncbi:MAG: hypothetical protein ACRCZ2_12610 [Fusobacteriaceae bacterium]
MKKVLVLLAIAAVSFGAQAKHHGNKHDDDKNGAFETGNGFEAACNAYGYWMTKAKNESDVGDLEVLARRRAVKEAGGLDSENESRCRLSMKRGERRYDREKN